MGRENLHFRSEKEFCNWARRNAHVRRWEKKDIEDLILHEMAHFRKARSLGYYPHYGVYAIFGPEDRSANHALVLSYFIDYRGKKPNARDLIEIYLAPQNPSAQDLENAARWRKALKNHSKMKYCGDRY